MLLSENLQFPYLKQALVYCIIHPQSNRVQNMKNDVNMQVFRDFLLYVIDYHDNFWFDLEYNNHNHVLELFQVLNMNKVI